MYDDFAYEALARKRAVSAEKETRRYWVVHLKDGSTFDFDKKSGYLESFAGDSTLLFRAEERGRSIAIIPVDNILWVEFVVEDIPAADVRPVVYGEWVNHYCSGVEVKDGFVSTCCDMWNNRKSDFCPHCGADMRGKGE